MASRPHIVIFSALFMPHLGGVEKYSQSIASELSTDHDVTVFCMNTEGQPEVIRKGAVTVHYLPCFSVAKKRFPVPTPAAYRKIRKVLRESPADFAIVQCRFYLLSLWTVKYLEREKTRFIQIEHGAGNVNMPHPLVNFVWHLFEKTVTDIEKKVPHDFYGVSNASIRWLKHFGIEGRGVLSNSVDPADFVTDPASGADWRRRHGIPEGRLLISFTGRIMPEKGVTDLLEAFDRLNRPDICLVMAGAGDMSIVAPWQGRENIRFPGHVDFSEIPGLLKASDIFCLPSRFIEGQPTSILEAGCCGTPVVATANGGIIEVIENGVSGLLVESENVSELTAALQQMIDDPELRKSCGQALNRKILDRFTWASVADKIRAIIGNIPW